MEYEPLPAVFDPAEAMKPDAPVLHGESVKSETRLDRDQFSILEEQQRAEHLSRRAGRYRRRFQGSG